MERKTAKEGIRTKVEDNEIGLLYQSYCFETGDYDHFQDSHFHCSEKGTDFYDLPNHQSRGYDDEEETGDHHHHYQSRGYKDEIGNDDDRGGKTGHLYGKN